MTTDRDDLTAKQKDYAVFLPAISSFFSTYIGRQRHEQYVDPARIPQAFPNGMESLNFFNDKEGLFHYKWALYSAGHANLDLAFDAKEDMIRNRDPNTFLLGDSGGFQIGKGVWEGDWKNPACPKAQKKREQVLAWMDAYMDRGMILDIPAWVARSPKGKIATGITSYEEAVFATEINNNYFMANRTGRCKFLNVLQGENHTEADDWYERMKKYCDPKQYPSTHFDGWAMGGQNMCDVHLVLKRIITIAYDGLLEEGKQDWMHFLGTSKLEWALLLTDIQRAVRKYINPAFTISFDCASPFLATANGQIYVDVETEDRKKWVYRMQPTADNKKYATDSRSFRDAVLQEGIHSAFLDSPISRNMKISDVCIYKPGDLNKLGKEGRTSWDSFSYALMMGHNVWSHINAVQEANRQYTQGIMPAMMDTAYASNKKKPLQYNLRFFSEIVDAIFSAKSRAEAIALVDHFDAYWRSIPGTRGAIGEKTINPSTNFSAFFTEEEEVTTTDEVNSDFDESKLDALEATV